jgi:hypothetical protein
MTATTTLVDRQIEGFNAGNIDDVVAGYADDVRFVLVCAHTLPGSELQLEGKEQVTKHLSRVIKHGISDVELDWVGAGDGWIAWRNHGTFWGSTPFSEAHTARLNDAGEIVEHVIHSVYAMPS